jgi:hypothetical protein
MMGGIRLEGSRSLESRAWNRKLGTWDRGLEGLNWIRGEHNAARVSPLRR